jgi:hypothetical protein
MSTDLALAADPSIVERAADPAEFVIQACERAKAWLREALDHGEIDQIVECKSQAEAIRVYTMSKQLGKDAELAATEIVRRAERGIGLATRRGQAEGTIRRHGENHGHGGDYERNGKTVHVAVRPVDNKVSPGEYAGNGNARVATYVMTDGVSDEDFEEAVSDARGEGNLSRANLVRKIQARKPPAPLPQRNTKRHPGGRKPHADTLLHCVLQLQGTVERLAIELSGGLDESVSPTQAGNWADDLTKVIRPLSHLRIQLKEKASG